jgi:6-pyruvoyltetrahydropterin/6-carboxytetrahydropterin synthase
MHTAYLNRRYRFSASHRLHADTLSDEQNQMTYGKCNNPHGHGHNYIATIRLSGPVDPSTGMVANLADLDQFAREHLLEPMHLVNLNTLPAFQSVVPTTENLAVEVFRIFSTFPIGNLESVRVEETPNNSFIYMNPSLDAASLRRP